VQAVQTVLRYCYNGGIDVKGMQEECVESMLRMAHHYGMGLLKECVDAILASSITTENVVRRAILADKCSAKELKKVGLRVGGCLC